MQTIKIHEKRLQTEVLFIVFERQRNEKKRCKFQSKVFLEITAKKKAAAVTGKP